MGAQFDFFRYLLIPMMAVVVGGAISAIWNPSSGSKGQIQHFTAGVVLAAVATELLPEVTQGDHLLEVTFGFALGVGLMVTIRLVSEWMKVARFAIAGILALILTVGIDIFVDGMLVGISFLAGASEGMLVTLALTLEAFFLTLAAATTLRERGQSKFGVIVASIALAMVLGGGITFGGGMFAGAPTALLRGVMAFAVAALLYLVVEELLVQAHKMPETKTATVLFFIGFFCVIFMENLFETFPIHTPTQGAE